MSFASKIFLSFLIDGTDTSRRFLGLPTLWQVDLCQNFDDSLLDWILKRYAFSCVRMVQNGKSMFSSLKINFRLKIKKNNQYRIICKCNIIVEKGTYPFLEVGMVMFRKIILSNLFWRKFYWANTLRDMNITYLEKLSCHIFWNIFPFLL